MAHWVRATRWFRFLALRPRHRPEPPHPALRARSARTRARSGGIPPPLLDGPQTDPGLADAASKAQAALDWSAWWGRVVTERARVELGPKAGDPPLPEWRRALVDAHRLTFDPPDWASQARAPGLQGASRALWREACDRFTRARQPYLPPGCRDVFAWARVRDAAKERAASRHVSFGAPRGLALVLLAEGVWWELAGPGAAVCSVEAAQDPDTTEAILTAVFTSHLEAA